jgi:hypothetical protein
MYIVEAQVKRAVKRKNPLGGNATASLYGMKRSEKAEVLEKA